MQPNCSESAMQKASLCKRLRYAEKNRYHKSFRNAVIIFSSYNRQYTEIVVYHEVFVVVWKSAHLVV